MLDVVNDGTTPSVKRWNIERLEEEGMLAAISEGIREASINANSLASKHAANGGAATVIYHHIVACIRARICGGRFRWLGADLANVAAADSPDGDAAILFASGFITGSGAMVVRNEHGNGFANYFRDAQADLFRRRYGERPRVFVVVWDVVGGNIARVELRLAAVSQPNPHRPSEWEERKLLIIPAVAPVAVEAVPAFVPTVEKADVTPKLALRLRRKERALPQGAPPRKTASRKRAAKEVTASKPKGDEP